MQFKVKLGATSGSVETGIGPGVWLITANFSGVFTTVSDMPVGDDAMMQVYLEDADISASTETSTEEDAVILLNTFVPSKLVHCRQQDLQVVTTIRNGTLASGVVFICAERVG